MEKFYFIGKTQRGIFVIIFPWENPTIMYFTMLPFNFYYLTSVAVGSIIFFSLANLCPVILRNSVNTTKEWNCSGLYWNLPLSTILAMIISMQLKRKLTKYLQLGETKLLEFTSWSALSSFLLKEGRYFSFSLIFFSLADLLHKSPIPQSPRLP